jgi:hypothetical protein
MSATRTQIYLSEEQRRRVDAVAASEGVSMAEVIRRALDAFLLDEAPAEALSSTFGVDPEASAPTRDEWSRG